MFKRIGMTGAALLSVGAVAGAAAQAQQPHRAQRPRDCSTSWPYAVYQGKATNLYASHRPCFYYRSGGGSNGWLTFRRDGNLVVYGAGKIVWQTHTAGRGYRFSILPNGDFAIYTRAGKFAWQNHANTHVPHRKHLGYWLGLDTNASGTVVTGATEGISVPGSEEGSTVWSSDHGFNN